MNRYEGVETTTTEKKKKRTAGKWEGGGGKIKRGSASSSIKARHIRFICLENFSPLIKSCYTLHRKSTPQLNMQTKEPLALFFCLCVCVFSETFRTLRSKLFLLFSLFFFFLLCLFFSSFFFTESTRTKREREKQKRVSSSISRPPHRPRHRRSQPTPCRSR